MPQGIERHLFSAFLAKSSLRLLQKVTILPAITRCLLAGTFGLLI